MESVFQRISAVASAAGDKTAFLFMDENEGRHEVSFARFREDIHRAAGEILAISRRSGAERFGILAANSYDYIVSILGILGAGKTVVLLNIETSFKELDYEIELAELPCILHDGRYAELEDAFLPKYGSRLLDMDFYRDAQPCYELAEPDMSSLGVLLFTSGTTGMSKGVMLSHENVAYGVDSCFDYLDRFVISGEGDMIYECFPFYHVGGLTDALCWILTGKPMVISLDKRFFFRDLGAYSCSYISLVPAILETIRKYFRRGRTNCIGSVRKILTSAAYCEQSLIEFFKDYSIDVYQLYGLSENTGIGLMNFTDGKFDSIGIEQKHVQFRLDEGEICLSGKAVMMGYMKNPEATEAILQDGWLHTGDLGRVDEEGFVYITGRKKNLIILASGENVSPEELESLILQDARVTEVVVREEGSKICAEIYCDADACEGIRAHVAAVNTQLPQYKHIGLVLFREEPFPRTATGKIKR